MSNGFIKLHRKMLNWEWYTDIPVKVLFLHLLMRANHQDGEWRGVPIKRGQLISGRKKLATETGLSEQQVKTALKKLASSTEINQQSTKLYTLYTIENYDKFQSRAEAPTNKQPTINQQSNQQLTSPATTNKKLRSKEVKDNTHTPGEEFKNPPLYKTPTLDEVTAFCDENNLVETDPNQFFYHYDARGWAVNGVLITNWESLLRQWNRKDVLSGNTRGQNEKTTGFQPNKPSKLTIGIDDFDW